MTDKYNSGATEMTEQGRSRLLLLCLVRAVVEKHGGHLEIDDEANTFTVSIPESRKTACFKELQDAVGPVKQVCESSVFIQ